MEREQLTNGETGRGGGFHNTHSFDGRRNRLVADEDVEEEAHEVDVGAADRLRLPVVLGGGDCVGERLHESPVANGGVALVGLARALGSVEGTPTREDVEALDDTRGGPVVGSEPNSRRGAICFFLSISHS